MGSEHETIKYFLLELGKQVKGAGKPYYKRVYSGDQQPIDIRVKKRHTTYSPDVVWEREGKRIIFEIAFQDDLRQIVGEITLAAMADNCLQMYVLTKDWSKKEFRKLKTTISICYEFFKNKFTYNIVPINLSGSVDDMKEQIKEKLEKDDWI